ncbi:MAG: EAL domain-containing protein, partial [bacterium]|nr:EAL domain-containing protein [bacterium]
MGLQARVDITNGQTTDAEATIHWLHPSRGAVPAEEFMPLFEKNGFIAQIDEYTWEQACYCLRRWLDRDWKPVPIAVNLALLHFYKENFLKKLMTLLQQLDISPQLLELEMKAADAANFPEIRDKLGKLRDTGFKLGLNGLSGTILTLPKDSMLFDYVRLDGQYLDAQTTNQDFTRHVITLLGKLGLKTVVSGIISEQQVSFLKETGEHIIGQGPLFASSMPWSYFEKATFKEAQN